MFLTDVLELLPNPCEERCRVWFDSGVEQVSITLFDARGQWVRGSWIVGNGAGRRSVDIDLLTCQQARIRCRCAVDRGS